MLFLLILSILTNGILAGASLDISFKQLPSRHRLGVISYTKFVRTADLGNGKILYPILGIGSALLTLITFVSFFIKYSHLYIDTIPLIGATVLTILHLLCTTKAAPILLSVKKIPNEKRLLERAILRYEKWQLCKSIIQVLIFISLLIFLTIYVNFY